MYLFLGSLFYTGYIPKAPGTWASLVSLPLIYLISLHTGIWGLSLLLIASCLITLIASPMFEQVYGKDPGPMVMDEFAGQTLTFYLITFTGTSADLILISTGFLLFRLLDIYKPLGINNVQKLKGGMGILLDDLIAGLYAYVCLIFIILIIL